MTAPLLQARDLSRVYTMRRGLFGGVATIRAVDRVSLEVARGETLGIVGESGSGKSTTGRLLLGLEEPDEGTVRFDGAPIPPIGGAAWRRQRARMQMVFQDPLGALDRRWTVADQIREPMDIHGLPGAADRVAELLDAVGLSARQGRSYPHELSGGQRQRVVVARALATRPDLIVCDEPVSALDVSIQAQVVNLLADLQAALGLAMVFVSHDLRVVRQVSRRVAVMYLGRVVEEGDADTVFADPLHPYTRALVSAAPEPGGRRRDRIVLTGDPPDPARRPTGCPFHPRCPDAVDRCRAERPELRAGSRDRRVACHLATQVSPSAEPELAR